MPLNSQAHINAVLDRQAVTPLVEQHLRGEQNRRLLIWLLLNVEALMQGHLDS